MTDYPMCPTCRRADIEVSMARDVREPCPHCGGVLIESLRACCVPGCRKSLPVTRELPVCDGCGVKIAVAHLNDAARYDAVMAEARRKREAADAERRNGKPGEAQVYYVRLDERRIKIGFTSQLQARMRALRVHPTDLLAVEPGGREVEKARHAQFATERLDSRMEDFEPSDRLLEWISDVEREHGLPSWAKVPDTRVVRRTA